MPSERVLAVELIEALAVVPHPELFGHHRRLERGLTATGGGTGRRGGRRRARGGSGKQDRNGDQGHDQGNCGQQHPSVAHIAIEVAQHPGCLDLLHGELVVADAVEEGVDVGVELVAVAPGAGVAIALAGVAVDGAGPVGVAPPVSPCSSGVRYVVTDSSAVSVGIGVRPWLSLWIGASVNASTVSKRPVTSMAPWRRWTSPLRLFMKSAIWK